MSAPQTVSNAVAKLYDTYPLPPEPILDEPSPGYNWRWNWLATYSFVTGRKPPKQDIRILDAGCGSGVGTLKKCDGNSTVAEILVEIQLGLDGVRTLMQQQLLILTPA